MLSIVISDKIFLSILAGMDTGRGLRGLQLPLMYGTSHHPGYCCL